MENSMKPADNLATLENWFTEAEDASIDARDEGERARDYLDGNQLTSEEVQELRRRGQPPVVINRIRRKIEWLLGLEIKQRTDPRAFPRTPEHEQAAEAATDGIRYVCDNVDWDQARTAAYENMLVEGYGGVEVIHRTKNRKDGSQEVEIEINQYPWDRLFYDPHSRRHDFSDARYKGAVVWMDEADFKAEYPDTPVPQTSGHGTETNSDTYDDKPADRWVDKKRHRVRVIFMWYRKNASWHWCKFVQGTKIDGGESPYLDEDGQSVCPLIMQSLYVGRDNERYGIIRDMFDPQDEINKRRSKALHSVNSRQTMGIKGVVDSVAALKRELAKPDGHVELNGEAVEDAMSKGMRPFEMIPTGDQAAAQFQLLQEAKNEIDLMGANSALEGEVGNGTSGRAVLARQQGGMIEIAASSDRLHNMTREVYRHVWQRIQQYWTEEKWIRVTDDERKAQFVTLNQPVTLMDKFAEMDEQEVIAIAQQMQIVPNDPRLQMVVEIKNNVAEIDVDIILEEVPDQVTLQGETFEALLRYANAGQLPPAVLIEADPNLPAKKKEKILEMLQQPPAPSPQEQLTLAGEEAKVAKTQAETQKIQSEIGADPRDPMQAAKDQAGVMKTMAETRKIQSETGMPLATYF